MARPRKEIKRDKSLQISLTASEFSELKKLADLAGMRVSAFCRANLLAMLRN